MTPLPTFHEAKNKIKGHLSQEFQQHKNADLHVAHNRGVMYKIVSDFIHSAMWKRGQVHDYQVTYGPIHPRYVELGLIFRIKLWMLPGEDYQSFDYVFHGGEHDPILAYDRAMKIL